MTLVLVMVDLLVAVVVVVVVGGPEHMLGKVKLNIFKLVEVRCISPVKVKLFLAYSFCQTRIALLNVFSSESMNNNW